MLLSHVEGDAASELKKADSYSGSYGATVGTDLLWGYSTGRNRSAVR
jgi:hypothetical protein